MPVGTGTIIGIAASGVACSIAGFFLARTRRNAPAQVGSVKSEVLRDGMPLRFALASAGSRLPVQGGWSGWILRNDGSALSLSAEWESDFPGQTPPKFPVVGDPLTARVTGTQSLYQFASSVLDSREDAERPAKRLLVIALPAEITTLQRRRSPRQLLTVPATLELAENRSALPQHGTIKDISAGGLRAELGSVVTVSEATRLVETYKAGTLLRIRLPLPLIPSEGILARVCSCERTAQRGGLGVRIACEFLPMPNFDADLVISQLFRTQGKVGH